MPHGLKPVGFPDPGHDHAPCIAETLQRAEKTFADKGIRFTPLRRCVLQEVAGSHSAIGAYDVLDRLAKNGGRRLAPISVYRALESLVEAGMVHRLESRNAFFACHSAHASDRRHVVLACEACGGVAEVAAERVFEDLSHAADEASFQPRRALVEVIGRCGRCVTAGGVR